MLKIPIPQSLTRKPGNWCKRKLQPSTKGKLVYKWRAARQNESSKSHDGRYLMYHRWRHKTEKKHHLSARQMVLLFNEINPFRDSWNAFRAWNMASPCDTKNRLKYSFQSVFNAVPALHFRDDKVSIAKIRLVPITVSQLKCALHILIGDWYEIRTLEIGSSTP